MRPWRDVVAIARWFATSGRARWSGGPATDHAGIAEAALTAGSAPPRDLCVARIAAQQHGRIGVDQLRACGLDDAAVARRVRKGQLHRVHIGVYPVGHGDETPEAQFMAAVLAGGGAAHLSH